MRRLFSCFALVALMGTSFAAVSDAQPQEPAQEKAPAKKQPVAPTRPKEQGIMSKASMAIVNASSEVTNQVVNGALKMRDLFDTVLPGALGKNHLELDFEPKAGDLVRRQFVRYPITLRYGLSDRTEIYGGLTPVMPNPFKDGIDHRWSTGMATLGVRKDLTFENFYFPKVAVGLENTVPLGEPPVDLIDHYVHVRPYVTLSRKLQRWPDTTFLVSLSHDVAVKCPNRENVPAGVIKRNVTEISPGLLYMPNEFGAFAQYSFVIFDEPMGQRYRNEEKIGFLWDVPQERSRKWHAPGKWQLELGYKIANEDEYGTTHGVQARVRWKTDLLKRKKKD